MQALRLFKPLQVRASELTQEVFDESVRLVELPLPEPASGELLVRMSHSGINPSDLSRLQGSYGSLAQYEDIDQERGLALGYEGSGTVIAAGGLLAKTMVGNKVAFYARRAGTWASHVLVNAMEAFPLPEKVELAAAAFPTVNPITCVAFKEIAKQHGAKTVVITSAFSALGKQIVRYFSKRDVQVICIVRKAEQIEPLKELGALSVYDSTQEGWEKELKTQCSELDCKLAFDPVGGKLTGQVLSALAKHGTVYLYGAQGASNVDVPIHCLIFESKSVKGYWSVEYTSNQKSMLGKLVWRQTIPGLLDSDLSTEVHRTFQFPTETNEGILYHLQNSSRGKCVIKLQGEEAEAAEEPKVEESKDEEPKAEAEEPKAEEPKDEEPKAEAEEPKAEEPKDEEPKAEAEEPKAEEPKDEEPKAEAEEPKAEEPKDEEPKAEAEEPTK